jgi:hypothetical protein
MAASDGMVTEEVARHAYRTVAGSAEAVRMNRKMARREPALFALAMHEAMVVVRSLNEAEVEYALERRVRIVLSLVAARVYEALRSGQEALWADSPPLEDPVAGDLGPAPPGEDEKSADGDCGAG